jgi:hypothetical protein
VREGRRFIHGVVSQSATEFVINIRNWSAAAVTAKERMVRREPFRRVHASDAGKKTKKPQLWNGSHSEAVIARVDSHIAVIDKEEDN